VFTTVTAHKTGVPWAWFFTWIRVNFGPLPPIFGRSCGRGKYN